MNLHFDTTPAPVLEIRAFRNVVDAVTRALSGVNLPVHQCGAQAFVAADARTGKPISVTLPMIPDNASRGFLDAIRGFIDHEVAHILETDFTCIKPANLSAIAGGIQNICEDVRIERKMAARFRGSAVNLSATRSFVATQLLEGEYVKQVAAGAPQGTMLSLLIAGAIRALDGQPEFVEFMTGKWEAMGNGSLILHSFEPRIRSTKNTADTVKLAQDIYDALTNQEEPPKKGKGQDKSKPPKNSNKPCDKSDSQEDSDKPQDPGTPDKETPKDERDEEAEKPEPQPEKEEPEDKSDEKDESEQGDDGEGDDETQGDADEKDEPEQDKSDDEVEPEEGDADEPEQEKKEKDQPLPAGDEPEEEEDDDASEGDDAPDSGDEDGEGDDAGDGESEDGDDDQESEAGETGDEPGQSSEEDGDRNDEFDADEERAEHGESGAGVGCGFSPEELEPNLIKDLDQLVAEAINAQFEELMETNPGQYLPFTRDADYTGPFTPALLAQMAQTRKENVQYDSGYDYPPQIMKAVDEHSHVIQAEVERVFRARSASRWTPGHRKGKLNPNALHKLASGDDRVFRQKQEVMNKSVAVQLVVDMSGSMSGPKVQNAQIAALILSKVLTRIGVANEITGFSTLSYNTAKLLGVGPNWKAAEMARKACTNGDHFTRFDTLANYILKDFDKRLDDQTMENIAMIQYGAGVMNCNIDGESIMVFAQRLATRKETRKVMIVMSDGEPAGSVRGNSAKVDLADTIKRIEASGVEVYALGLDSHSVTKYYRHYEIVSNAAEIPSRILSLLQKIVIQ